MWYDILAVAIVAFTTIRGAMKGVIWQIAAIAGLVGCFVFSESISAAAGPYVKLDPPLNNWVVMIGAYLLFSLASFSVAKLLTEWLEKIHFGDFNRHLGAILGFVKGVLIVLVITFFSVTVSKGMHDVLKTSRTGHISARIMYHVHPVMPAKLHDILARYINIHTLDDPELQRKYEERRLHADDDDHDHGTDVLPVGGDELILPSDFEEILARMPRETQQEFRSLLMRSLNKGEREEQHNLLDGLWDAFSKVRSSNDVTSLMQTLKEPQGNLLASVTEWLTQPAGQRQAVTSDAPPIVPEGTSNPQPWLAAAPDERPGERSRRDELLDLLSREFSTSSLARARIRKDIESQLEGVPDAVAVAAMEDWLADREGARLRESGSFAWDPDPTTNETTSLKARIERQTAGDLPAAGGDELIR